MKVCVLGANGGIGKSVVDCLSVMGHEAIRVTRSNPKVARRHSQPTPEDIVYVDTSSLAALARDLDRILQSRAIDCVVNAIGIGRSSLSPQGLLPIPTTELSLPEWEEVIYVDLKLPIAITECAYRHQIRQVLHVGSALTAHGMRGTAMTQAYSASKLGLAQFCESFQSYTNGAMQVTCVAPGLVNTKMTQGSGLKMLFAGELSADTVARWIVDMLEVPHCPLSLLLPSHNP